jgi:hypothetical protein
MVPEMFSLRSLPRPTRPIAGELFTGGVLLAWGIFVLLFPDNHLTQVHSWQWLSKTGETGPVAVLAILIAVGQLYSAYKNKIAPGKVLAAIAMSLWFEFAVRIFTATPGIHPPACAVYFALAVCNILIVLGRRAWINVWYP